MARREIRGAPSAAEVYARADDSISLRQLDAALGYTAVFDESSIRSQWHHGISHRPLRDLGAEDLAFALREGVHIPMVLPLALTRLTQAPPTEETLELGQAVAAAARMVRKTLPELAERAREALRNIKDTAALARLEGPEQTTPPTPTPKPTEPPPPRIKSPYQ